MVPVPAGNVTLSVVPPLTALREAVTVAKPGAAAVASPAELIVATAAVAVVQVALVVMFVVEPSL